MATIRIQSAEVSTDGKDVVARFAHGHGPVVVAEIAWIERAQERTRLQAEALAIGRGHRAIPPNGDGHDLDSLTSWGIISSLSQEIPVAFRIGRLTTECYPQTVRFFHCQRE